MPRLMSFAKTVSALERDEKDVTRRDRWPSLRAGDVFEAVDRSPRGGKPFRRLGLFRVVAERWERLGDITLEEVRREGVLPRCCAAAGLESTPEQLLAAQGELRILWESIGLPSPIDGGRAAGKVVDAFVALYCAPGKPDPDREVHRIEFRPLAEGEAP